MSESIHERLQQAGAELEHANRHVNSIRQMGDGRESFQDLFGTLRGTVIELLEQCGRAYEHTAQAYTFGLKANQALYAAGFEVEADHSASEAKQKFVHALRPTIEAMENVGDFAYERGGMYAEALANTTKAMSVLQLRAADCQGNILELRDLIDKYPSP